MHKWYIAKNSAATD